MRSPRFSCLLILIFLVISFLSIPANADYQAGLDAYNRGDYPNAFEEFILLAEQGEAKAQLMLGTMYGEGQGVPQDYARAVKWHRMAAEQGNAQAQYKLGVSYALGQGVSHDNMLGYFWLYLAASKGEKETIDMRDYVAKSLTPSELAQAREIAANWHPKTWAELEASQKMENTNKKDLKRVKIIPDF